MLRTFTAEICFIEKSFLVLNPSACLKVKTYMHFLAAPKLYTLLMCLFSDFLCFAAIKITKHLKMIALK